nr:neuronal acetylcholine receptor subunit alpha-10-like [Lytechinus pictus]
MLLNFMRMMWIDENLTWDPSEYGGVNITTLLPSDVWTPDISLYENAQKDFISIQETYILVSYNGSMDWYFPAFVTSVCPIDITYFPYDVQECKISIGPWAYMKSMVHFQLSKQGDTTIDIFNRNGVWILERSVGVNKDAVLCCDNRTWSIIEYSITIRRMSKFYTKTVVVPAFLLTLLMALVCWLHPASGEKVTLAVSNLLALILFQQLVADRMPPSGETTSIIVSFFIVMIAMCCAEVLCSIFVLRIYHMGGQTEVPWLVRRIMLCPIILPLYHSLESKEVFRAQQTNYKKHRRSKRARERIEIPLDKTKDPPPRNFSIEAQIETIRESEAPDPATNALLVNHANNVHRPKNKLGSHHKNDIDPEMIAQTWRDTAIVTDKLIFFVLLLVTATSWVYMIVSFLFHS